MKNIFVYCFATLLWASTAHAVTTVTISWQDNANNEDGFTIERATSAAGPFAGVGTVGANVTFYVDTNLPEAAPVCYRVHAFNSAGASPYTGVICGITKGTANFNLNGANRGTDYDGDGKTDIAVYRGGNWYIVRSSDGAQTSVQWGGAAQDIPVAADYDGDGRSDIAVYRDGTWLIVRSSDGAQLSVQWGGTAQDIPVPADYDGDVKSDIAVYRNGVWYILRSSDGGITGVEFGGLAQDVPVPQDYDGDGKTDVAVYRNGSWFVLRSSDGGITAVAWGGALQDIPLN